MKNIVETHNDRSHAFLAPSDSKRWMNCPGSIHFGKNIPNPPQSPHAKEGTEAHEAAEKLLRMLTDCTGLDRWIRRVEYLDTLEDDLAEHISGYADFCLKVWDAFWSECEAGTAVLHIEKRFKLTSNIWGTSDVSMVGKRNGRWEIATIDFKYGAGVKVPAENNSQLIIYGLGVAQELQILPEKLWLYIYQPRGGGEVIKRATLNKKEIEEWKEKLINAEDYVLSIVREYDDDFQHKGYPSTKNNPNVLPFQKHLTAGDHCRWCKCQPICPVLHKQATDLLDPVEDSFGIKPLSRVPVEHLVQIQAKKKQIEHMLSAIEAHLTRLLEAGLHVPGYKLVSSKGKRSWAFKGKELASKLLEKGLTEDQLYKKSLLNLSDAEKILGKEEIIDLVSLPQVRNQIVSIEDEREQVEQLNLLEAIENE